MSHDREDLLMKFRPDGFPRRNDLTLFTPAERAIWDATQAVEEMPGHPLLTEAVILLGQAREKVADFVELPTLVSTEAVQIGAAPEYEHEHGRWEDDGGAVLRREDERPRKEPTVIRCKFQCIAIKAIEGPVDSPPTVLATMEARYSPELPEDQRFTKWTPSGTLEVTISNPEAVKQLRVGDQYYIDLERVPTE